MSLYITLNPMLFITVLHDRIIIGALSCILYCKSYVSMGLVGLGVGVLPGVQLSSCD